MKQKPLFLICTGVVLYVCGGVWQLRGQTTADVSATVQFSNGQTVSIVDFSDSIGIQPNELVNVRVQFTPDAIGEPIIVEALNGGSTSIGSSIRVAEADGSISFAFRATADPGRKSIGIRRGSRTFCLQLWVLDSANPQNNPPVITPDNRGS